jgi:branched-chain amino acid aminotransferase
MRLGRDLGYEVREQSLPREMLYLADEMFFCGTAVEITPVRSVDKIPVGSGKPGPVTRALQNEFMGIAKGRIPDRHGWLTPVPVAASVR